MSKKTVYEDRAEKEEKRRQKNAARLQRHVVKCPHCGGEALDHMTKCPKCGKEITPAGYSPMSEEKRKKIRMITYGIGFAVAIAVIVLVFVFRK